MPTKALLVLAAAVVAIAVPARATADYSLLDFQSAVDALNAVDPTIDPPPNDPSRDFAVGGFQTIDGHNFGFSALSGPLGQDPQGRLSETGPADAPSIYQARFQVTCLVTAGNRAGVGLVPAASASNDQTAEFVLAVSDSGLPGGTGDEAAIIPDVPAQDCAVGLGPFDVFPIERGNILVNDALP